MRFKGIVLLSVPGDMPAQLAAKIGEYIDPFQNRKCDSDKFKTHAELLAESKLASEMEARQETPEIASSVLQDALNHMNVELVKMAAGKKPDQYPREFMVPSISGIVF